MTPSIISAWTLITLLLSRLVDGAAITHHGTYDSLFQLATTGHYLLLAISSRT